jgi:hypothetical protein
MIGMAVCLRTFVKINRPTDVIYAPTYRRRNCYCKKEKRKGKETKKTQKKKKQKTKKTQTSQSAGYGIPTTSRTSCHLSTYAFSL